MLLLCSATTFAQKVRYVTTTGTTPATSATTSWATSTTDLQGAINASGPGDQVWVAVGVYKPSSSTARTASFSMKDGVAIYGGFSGSETSLNQRPANNPVTGPGGASQPSIGTPTGSTLSGDIGVVGNNSDNSYHVITNVPLLTTSAVLDGFVITGGNANGLNNNGYGGGVFNYVPGPGVPFSPLFRNCLFQDNQAALGGGMMNLALNNGDAGPQLINCAFRDNTATDTGGAMANLGQAGDTNAQLTNCTFQDNTANYAGAVYNAGFFSGSYTGTQLTNCSFERNQATVSGGAMYNYGNNYGISNPQLTNCSFMNNKAASDGGAMYNDGRNSGQSLLRLINCSLQGNTATSPSGALYNYSNVGLSRADLTNCIVWNNPVLNQGGIVIANYSLFDASSFISGSTNISTATSPFTSTATATLTSCSQALNAGSPLSQTVLTAPYSETAVPTTDLAGNPRIVDSRVDIGAVEFQVVYPARLYVSISQTAVPGDGQSWATAYPDLQQALNYACPINLTEIWVASGAYKPTTTTGPASRSISFAMKNGVSIYGGFFGTETMLSQRPPVNPITAEGRPGSPSSSTLSGDIGTVGNTNDNSYHVVSNPQGLTTGTPDRATLLDGFVITGGNANGGSTNNYGGGVFNNGRGGAGLACNPAFRNCLIQGNTAASYGGGMYNDGQQGGSASPELTNCLIQHNMAGSIGGGMYNDGVGGTASPSLLNCIFQNNSAVSLGGGMHNDGRSAGQAYPQLANCAFLNNTATAYGGAIANDSGSPVLTNCSLQGNTANQGGAIYNSNSFPLVTNSIFWNNGASNAIVNFVNSVTVARYCLVDAATTVSGLTNLTATSSPFRSATSVALLASSAAINAGNPGSVTVANPPYSETSLPTIDLFGNPRIAFGRVDIGAVELADIFTVKNGLWSDATVWNVNRVPVAGERVRLRHTLQVGDVFGVGKIVYESTGRAVFTAGGRLQLQP